MINLDAFKTVLMTHLLWRCLGSRWRKCNRCLGRMTRAFQGSAHDVHLVDRSKPIKFHMQIAILRPLLGQIRFKGFGCAQPSSAQLSPAGLAQPSSAQRNPVGSAQLSPAQLSPLFCFQPSEVPRVFQSSSPELRSMSGRNESFWDGLGPEIDGVRSRFLARAEYCPARNIPSDPSILIPLGINSTMAEPRSALR